MLWETRSTPPNITHPSQKPPWQPPSCEQKPTQGTIDATEDQSHAIRALDDLELVLAGGGGDVVADWG